MLLMLSMFSNDSAPGGEGNDGLGSLSLEKEGQGRSKHVTLQVNYVPEWIS